MAMKTEPAALRGDREIVVTRTFDAPRELVFRAWTEQQHLTQWWGPNGFTITTKTFEFREGGVWQFTMHGPDGRDYQNKMVFETIKRPERLVYHHPGDEGEGVDFRSVAEFKDLAGKTEVSMCMTFASFQAREHVLREHHADEGLGQTMARLGEYVSSMKGMDMTTDTQAYIGKEVTFTRAFAAPRELVFACWTDAKHLAAWWGPHHFTNPRCETDPRKGGKLHIDMRAPDGTLYPMAGRFDEVIPHERIVFAATPLDAQGKPMFETLNTVTLTEKDGKTTQVIRVRVVSATEVAPQFLDGMNEGWKQSLERLESHLKGAV